MNALGVGVAGVDIDVKNLGGGGDPDIFNDGTDANGFFHVTVPNGTYRVTFNPPQPPASTDLITEVEPVTITGTLDMGTTTLTPGVSVSGRILNPASAGVSGVNIDVITLADGNNAGLIYDFTDINGNFSFAAPTGVVELRFDATPVVGQTLASSAQTLTLSGNTTLGDLTLAQGYLITAIVRGPGGLPVVNCDLDAVDTATGSAIYTPGDDTSAAGFVDFVVPAGTFDFQFCPPFATQLAARRLSSQTVSATTNLGIQNLVAGHVLSGTILSHLGVPVSGVDIDLNDSTTGAPIALCGDNSVAGGTYSIVVPPGEFTVIFTPPAGQGLGQDVHYNVVVAANTVLNGTLPQEFPTYCFGDGLDPVVTAACPCGNFGGAGRGCANSFSSLGGKLSAVGLTNPNTIVITLSSIPNNNLTTGFRNTANANPGGVVFGDGVRCQSGTLIRFGAHNSGSGGDAANTWTSTTATVAPGLTRYYQVQYRNPSPTFCPVADGGGLFNISNGIVISW